MTKPYTYLLKHLPSSTYYYGVRYAAGCSPEDFWNIYFTSSSKVKELITKDGKDSFDYEIRKTFDNVKNAIDWETRVLRRMKLPHRSDFFNHRYSYAIPSMIGESHPLYGVGHSAQAKEKMSKSHSGKVLTEETRNKMSNSRLGEKNPCFGKFGADHPAYGSTKSAEFKEAAANRFSKNNPMSNLESRTKMINSIKELKWWTNGIVAIRAKQSPGESWKRGRKIK